MFDHAIASFLAPLRRLWQRDRRFLLLAVGMLGLAVAAAAATLAGWRAIAARPLPYAQADALYWVWSVRPDVDRAYFSIPDLHDFRARIDGAAAIAGLTPFGANLQRADGAERVNGIRASDNLFATLGVRPAHGRLLDAADAARGDKVVVLGWARFQRELDGDPARVGQSLLLNGEAWQVVGVLPPEFVFPGADADIEFAAPLAIDLDPRRGDRGANFLRLVVRARAGTSGAALAAAFASVSADLARQHPQANRMKLAPAVVPLREEMAGATSPILRTVASATLALLALVSANLAALLLLRGKRRESETGVRRALGADAWQALRPLVADLATLGALAATLAALLAEPLRRWLLATISPGHPLLQGANFDATSLLLALAALATMLLVMGAPAALAMRRVGADPQALRGAGGTLRIGRQGQWLLGIEIALAVTVALALATAAASWRSLRAAALGFEPAQIATARLALPANRIADAAALNAWLEGALERLREAGLQPAMTNALPLSQLNSRVDFDLPGWAAAEPGLVPTAQARWITPEYLELLGVAVRAGRGIESGDHAQAQAVVLVDRALAQRYWPRGDALGATLTLAQQGPTRVVGIVDDLPHFALGEAAHGTIYLPVAQVSPRYAAFVAGRFSLLAAGPGTADATQVQLERTLRAYDADTPPSLLRPLRAYFDAAQSSTRLATALLGVLGLFAAALCALGAYAVSAGHCALRERELAVRLALGCSRGHALWTLLRENGIGSAIGLVGGLLLGGVLQSQVAQALGGPPIDSSSLAVACAGLVVVAVALASWLPARRGAGASPARVLRDA